MTNELEIASAEITEIFKLLPEAEVNKVPLKLRKQFKFMAKNDYKVNLDSNKRLLEQNITEKTKDIIALLYRNYWCTQEKRKEIDKVLVKNEKIYQSKLNEKYGADKIFKNKITEKNITQEQTVALVQSHETIFTKMLNKIKKAFYGISANLTKSRKK